MCRTERVENTFTEFVIDTEREDVSYGKGRNLRSETVIKVILNPIIGKGVICESYLTNHVFIIDKDHSV